MSAQWRSTAHWMLEIFRNNTENKTGNIVPLYKSTVCSSSPTTTNRNSRTGKAHRVATNTFCWKNNYISLGLVSLQEKPCQTERGSHRSYKVMTGIEEAKLFTVLSKARSRGHQMASRNVKLRAKKVILHTYNYTVELPASRMLWMLRVYKHP